MKNTDGIQSEWRRYSGFQVPPARRASISGMRSLNMEPQIWAQITPNQSANETMDYTG